MTNLAKRQADFFGRIRELDGEQYLDALFIYSAAPVLRGAKPAVMVMIRRDVLDAWQSRRGILCQWAGLYAQELSSSGEGCLVFIYDRKLLEQVLADAKVQALLSCYGYPVGHGLSEGVNPLLAWLRGRFQECVSEFPHEIGLFLGYPADDVEAFIKYEGKNYASSRYWKVYHNIEEANEIFRRIEEASSFALKLLTEHSSTQTAASLLRAS